MKIVGAHWTPQVNWIEVQCVCDTCFDHRADRWEVSCPSCGSRAHLRGLRDDYAMLDPVVRQRMIDQRHPAA